MEKPEQNEFLEIERRFSDAVDAYNNWIADDNEEFAPPKFWAAALDVAAAVAKNHAAPRFLAARKPFANFVAAVAPFLTRRRDNRALIDSKQASGDSAIWTAWRDICATLDAFDANRRRAVSSATRSTRSIEDLRKAGVSSRQICRIVGFWRDDDAGGSPDLDRLARAESGDASAFDAPSSGPPNYSESPAANLASPPPETGVENVKGDFTDSLDFYILEGMPLRQIAGRFNLDVETVRQRFSELGVFQADGVISLTPRAQLAAKAWLQENPGGSYADCAEAVSSANKPVSGEDVAAFVERLQESEGLDEIYSEIGNEENVLPGSETDAQIVEGKKRRKK